MVLLALACSAPQYPSSGGASSEGLVVSLDAHVGVSLTEARIWNGLSADGDEAILTTMVQRRLVSYRLDDELQPSGAAAPLTGEGLPDGSDITDHAQVLHDGVLYVALCDPDAKDLWVLQADPDGEWFTEPIRIANDSPVPTHDMHITSGDGLVWVVWGNAIEREVRALDGDLDVVESYGATLEMRASGLGSTIFENGAFTTFAGSESNRAVMAYHYGRDWTPEHLPVPVIHEDDAEVIGDWQWFPSGVTRDPVSGWWALAYTSMPGTGRAETDGAVKLALLDPGLQLSQTWTVTPAEGWTRPHLAIVGDDLLLSYDANQEVRVEAFEIL